MIKYECSDGTRVSQATIDARLRKAYAKHEYFSQACQCCHESRWEAHDHTISQKTCKEVLHKAELVWDHNNWSYSCHECHQEWESYKSGAFQHHANVVRRMLFVKEHDPEGYQKRLAYITDEGVLKILETEF